MNGICTNWGSEKIYPRKSDKVTYKTMETLRP